MFSLERGMRYWLYSEPTDMRKRLHTLSGLVRNKIGGDPTVGIVRRRLDGEEREQDKQFHQLDEGELAVRILNRTHRFGLYDELIHHVAYRIDCLAGVIMF